MTAYYNENDPYAAARLRELIAQKIIAPGHVDDRSMLDVSASDIKGYTQCHWFAGIGCPLVARVPGSMVHSSDKCTQANATREAYKMRLRDYGNAICIDTAELFIRSMMEVINE